jgi:uncharacterized membrane protein YdjX (TVP38/TMEM64 family)
MLKFPKPVDLVVYYIFVYEIYFRLFGFQTALLSSFHMALYYDTMDCLPKSSPQLSMLLFVCFVFLFCFFN